MTSASGSSESADHAAIARARGRPPSLYSRAAATPMATCPRLAMGEEWLVGAMVDNHPPTARVRQEEHRFGAMKSIQIGSAALRAQNEERVVERIAGRSAARQHRNAQYPLHRAAG